MVPGDIVVDRRTLLRIFTAMSGALGVLGPLIFALKPPPIPDGTTACELTEQETALIRAAMAGRNTSCTYDNITLSAVLDERADWSG